MKKISWSVLPFAAKPAAVIFLTLFALSFCFSAYAEKMKVRVGAYDNPPKIRIEKSGKVSGFWPELISIIAAAEDWEIEYVKGGWAAGLENLSKGKIDIMPDVAFTLKRSKLYDFNRTPVLASWSRVYVRADDNDIKSLEDLANKRIAGLFASVNLDGPDGIKRLVQSFNLNSTIVEMQSYDDVFEALKEGFVDAVITNRSYGDEYTKNHPVKKTPIMLQPVSLLFAFPANSEKAEMLSRRIDFQLSKMTSDTSSVYYDLLTKYFETEIAEKKVKELPAWVIPTLIITAIILLFLASLSMLSRKQVKTKTKQLVDMNKSLQKTVAEETARRLRKEKIIFEQKKFADMGQMIGAISHQWRQPLNNIYLIAQVLEDRWESGEKFSDENAQSFEQMSELVNHMSETIDDFRNFFSPDKGKEVFNINDTILTCLRLVNSELIHQKINIIYSCQCEDGACEAYNLVSFSKCKGLKLNTWGYPGEFKQIMLNILSNSKDAIIETNPDYKKISVTARPVKDKVTIIVEDTGGGIDEEILPKVFDPYFSTKTEGLGIGIGLFMSKTILEKHMNGDIKLENIPGGLRTIITMDLFNSSDL